MKNKKILTLIIGAAILVAGSKPANAQTEIQSPSVNNTTKEYVTAIKVQAAKRHKSLPSKRNIDSNEIFAIQFSEAFGAYRQGTYCVVMVDGEMQNE